MSVFRDFLAGLVGRRLPVPASVSALVAAVLAAGIVAGCGGGTSQVVAYIPDRLIVLGEESSVLDDSADAGTTTGNARKYTVNGIDTTTSTASCSTLPIVPQFVAARYGMVFGACLGGATTTPTAFDYAKAGARVEGVDGLHAQLARAGALGAGDLLTVWFGVNDLIDIYRRQATGEWTEAQALAEAQRLGMLAAQIISDEILATGAHALVFTAPDVGLSPYARARVTTADPAAAGVGPDADAMTRLSKLASEFNGYLRVSIDPKRYDGRNYGLVFPDEAVQAINANPANFTAYLASPYNVTDAVCTVADLRACTSATDATGANSGGMVAGTTFSTNLWAGDRWLSYPAHYLIGTQAQSRLNALPF